MARPPVGIPDPTLIELTIERIVPGGAGLGHLPGKTIFVPFAAPGDRVRARVERSTGKLVHASLIEVIEPGPDRIDPGFPELLAGGAVDFAHLNYPTQLRMKSEILLDAMRRTGGLALEAAIDIQPSPREWGYRARAAWHYDPGFPVLGYMSPRSHQVVDLPADPLVEPLLAAAFETLRQQMNAGRLPDAVKLYVAATAGGLISLDPTPGATEPAPVTMTVAGEQLSFDARCFFQANTDLLEPLIAEALRFAEPPESGESLAIDLYSGVGLFTLPLARRFKRVIGVESDLVSAAFAQDNALYAGLTGVRIAPQPVEEWSRNAYQSYGKAPFLLADPPRSGLSPATMRGLLRIRPARIAYVSCDPVTLARDLKLLLAEGYELQGLAAFDMFPQTHHVETVAHFRLA